MQKDNLINILTSLQKELKRILGDQLESIYLYGSQARGDAKPDSDIDLLIVIRGDFDYSKMMKETSDPAWRLSLDNDIVISRVFVTKEKYDLLNSPFLMNIHREAILV